MRSIYITNVKLKPILEKLSEGEKRLEEGQALLDKLNEERDICEKNCDKLSKEALNCQNHKERVAKNLSINKQRLIRATKLLSGLKDEQERWKIDVEHFKGNLKYIAGDSVIAAGILS